MSLLAHIDTAKKEILAAESLVKVKDLWNKAEAVRQLGQAAKDHNLITYANEFKLRCERRLGEMLRGMKDGGELKTGAAAHKCREATTLTDYGISRDISSRAQKIASVPEEEFEAVIAQVKDGERELTRKAVEKLLKRADKQPEYKEQTAAGCTVDDLYSLVGAKTFSTIYADPPWLYGNQGTRAATGNHYSGMTVSEIAALPIKQLAAENAHLHLWTTNAFLFDCKAIMEAWGFEYKSCYVWVKPQMGIGNYWRVSHEFMLFGIRGKCPFADRGQKSWGEFDRTKHSAKPERIREIIQRTSPGPYLELFGRRPADGWVVWGNEVERNIFEQAVAI